MDCYRNNDVNVSESDREKMKPSKPRYKQILMTHLGHGLHWHHGLLITLPVGTAFVSVALGGWISWFTKSSGVLEVAWVILALTLYGEFAGWLAVPILSFLELPFDRYEYRTRNYQFDWVSSTLIGDPYKFASEVFHLESKDAEVFLDTENTVPQRLRHIKKLIRKAAP